MDNWELILFYAIGTIVGAWMAYGEGIKKGVGESIDRLCEAGYLKHTKHRNGDIEIHKPNGER